MINLPLSAPNPSPTRRDGLQVGALLPSPLVGEGLGMGGLDQARLYAHFRSGAAVP